MEKLSNSSHFLDLGGLDSLRAKAQKNDKAALKEVAQQFEGIFVQMLMKSMREANAAFESDSPMNSQYTKFYEQMHDQQMSLNLSDKGMLGLADLMIQQLSPETSKVTPSSVLRNDGNLGGGIEQTMVMSRVARSESQSSPQSESHKKAASDPLQTVLSGKQLPSEVPYSNMTFNDRNDFVAQLYPHAQKAAAALGTQAEVLIAQSALETGWGQKMVKRPSGDSSNNLFNIKADNRWQGNKAAVKTLEFDQGIAVQQRADFRVYDNIKQSFDDFVSFISEGPRYQEAMKKAANPNEFIKALQDAGYATDPKYADKVMKVMKSLSSEIQAVLPREAQ
ncbi:flagellar assembly peptidoglycan hydrolase FlgJ [Shewanella sp. D64]|uniref:flagellar assembly peptidoglycan hydrolase FlgJ n=1 Tax=unclassified Shewanella TaxID=196818 RepID=UPI0022BA682C|nr:MULTISPECIES: flagellar assembly peptidoglycan hydrolase FlgJ [unclassified Shewanella]MEC4726524.1 flagellar assembly peptidoglycan hydrolase FlgJ [Shewanella sp. D64]MEC4737435.1 flagellar assembly peptidoglycan hydrolase FlgJ [Shewanella sp. E94]WBJ97251.1 flagellar assembly peptidoglycan hydrolase FlgJ [Shewanella sp. MTB7]